MTRHDVEHYRWWPWVLAIFAGLLTTAGGGAYSVLLGTAIMTGGIVMIIRAGRHNRAVRHGLAAAAQATKPRKRQAAASRSRRPGAGRRAARKAMTLLH